MHSTSRQNSRGFTLIELLVVIAIIAVLASIAYPVFTGVQERARVTQDLNNLRQIGIATQMYLNDNDSVIFSTDAGADTWMVALHKKYLPSWKIFESPFDKRAAIENDTTAPVSYGINGNGIVGLSSDKITKPSVYILFAPAQNSDVAVNFSGTVGTGSPGVTVYKAQANGTTAIGGTQSGRRQINALFADLHTENITWSKFINDTASPTDGDAKYRWDYAGKP